MMNKFKNLGLAVFLATSMLLVGCSDRDKKIGTLSKAQIEEVVGGLTLEENRLFSDYVARQQINIAIGEMGKMMGKKENPNQPKVKSYEELSVNEIIKLSKEGK